MHSASTRLGVDAYLPEHDDVDVPECPHGPMLLFERFIKNGGPSRQFYACSASRDRKDCSFFQWKDEKVTVTRKQAHEDIIKSAQQFKTKFKYCEELKELFSSKDELFSWVFCHTCSLIVLNDTEAHEGHDLQRGEKLEDLRHPSSLLKPSENVKAQAQFLFSNKATEFLVTVLRKLGFKKVLCLGTPRIHEKIQQQRSSISAGGKKKPALDSLLLDIDYRYSQFYPSSHFGHYNMFNHHFFVEESEKTLKKFLTSSDKVVLVMDPPFGGMVEILAANVKKIWTLWKHQQDKDGSSSEMPTMWIFPYFMESHIQTSLPSFKMIDYKVDYDNHPHFKGKQDKGSKRGSPVRIFTNIDQGDIKLPVNEGYRFCDVCKRSVASENVHCPKCDTCPSKDGRTYVHCDQCRLCVKPGRVHCTTCGRCEIPSHDCQRLVTGCHICGVIGHKRRDCPERMKPNKRKTEGRDSKKKKRHKAMRKQT